MIAFEKFPPDREPTELTHEDEDRLIDRILTTHDDLVRGVYSELQLGTRESVDQREVFAALEKLSQSWKRETLDLLGISDARVRERLRDDNWGGKR